MQEFHRRTVGGREVRVFYLIFNELQSALCFAGDWNEVSASVKVRSITVK